ncbi:MAG TPA: hypothetical protein VFS08_03685 [Gemmatimonadaceae bacterium]|nr:hypothetical protein [Gemmatimonadaceae bacterium]
MTETHRHASLTVLAAVALLLAGCDARPDAGRPAADAPPDTTSPAAVVVDSAGQQAVRDVVTRFGEQLRNVSLLAPDSILTASLREAYAPFVTPELLAAWTARPDSAPGRRVSSPWPERIRIDSLRTLGAGRVAVTGAVLYVTSAERAQGEGEGEGEGASAATAPVRLEVSRGDDGQWRISTYAEGAAGGGAP